jgi:hypothetical protein
MPARTSKTASSAETASKPKPKGATFPAAKHPKDHDQEETAAATTQAPTSVQPVEPEDAYLTGVSRSLQRRLLGLNVEGSQGQSRPHPETVAGLHATGSFTGTKSVPAKQLKSSKKN